eukprot:CAMPEP_0179715854 /NCGR_PEP_ID=MMETSP0938-20121108/1557_1 /TAXON_ID=548131 ORGANISM="Ostreococcus mediterraneus, Strain clade-D-RCC1107" /NCGR_SAMPLE_ID=MMETSP0938 /ASSEMBLY_ACC=CAM_ASM_000576 /LENGTH=192 /DNA_ID=CAMNT_0021589537 /DNA_START=242 /DNA_END=820 /DNA_ORIENTATION=-
MTTPVVLFTAARRSRSSAVGASTRSTKFNAETTSKPSLGKSSCPISRTRSTTPSTVSLSSTTLKFFSRNRATIPGELSVAHTLSTFAASRDVTSPQPAPTSNAHSRPHPVPANSTSTCDSLNTNIFPRPITALASVSDIVRRSSVHRRARRSCVHVDFFRDEIKNSFVSSSRSSGTNASRSASDVNRPPKHP